VLPLTVDCTASISGDGDGQGRGGAKNMLLGAGLCTEITIWIYSLGNYLLDDRFRSTG